MTEEALLDCVAAVVAAHVRNNSVTPSQLPQMVRSVYASLAEQRASTSALVHKPPMVVGFTIKSDAILCLECGATMKLLKRHLRTHNLTPAAYKARWDLSAQYPMVAPEYATLRRKIAKDFGLGRGSSGKSAASTISSNISRPRLVLIAGTALKT